MRLSDIRLESKSTEGADLRLLDPITYEPLSTDKEKPQIIRLVGIDSKQYRKALAKITNRELNKPGNKKLSVEKTESRGLELLAACTVGWHIQIDEDKTEAAFSIDAALELYRGARWIKEQVDEFIGDRANFLKRA